MPSAIEITDNKVTEQDTENGDSNLLRRTGSSTVRRPSFSLAPLDDNTFAPIPESLPTTPGYELEEGGMLRVSSLAQLFPKQQGSENIAKELKKVLKGPLTNTEPVPLEVEAPAASPKLMTLNNPPRNWYRYISGCCWTFMCGFADGAIGSLLPSIESYYSVSYSIVSMIWLGNSVGFILVAVCSSVISKHLTIHSSVSLCTIFQGVQFAIVLSGTKFPAIVFGFFVGGIGTALGLSQHNLFYSRFDRASVLLGIFHGCYGIGATLGPFVATIMLSHKIKWHYFYGVLLGLAVFNTIFVSWAYTGTVEDIKSFDLANESIEMDDLNKRGEIAQDPPATSEVKEFWLAVKLVRTWLLSLFVFFYQGAEVGFGSWTVTFLLDYRHSNPDTTGYVTSGFWAGVTLSRLILTPLCVRFLGNRRSIILLSIATVVFDIFTWQIRNVVGAAVFASLVGVAIGPSYPLMVGMVTKVLPRKVQVISMTIMTAFGSSGGALFPFLIGLVSQFTGTYVMHPICITLMSLMLITWVCLPNVERIAKQGPPKGIWQQIW